MDTTRELNHIRKSIEELHTELILMKGEIRKLRLVIQAKKREKPKEATLTSPRWCYEWDCMTVDLDSKTWKKVKDGELVVATRSYKSTVRNSDSRACAASSKFIAVVITHGCMNPYRLGPRRTKP